MNINFPTVEQIRLLTRNQLFNLVDEVIRPHDVVAMRELLDGFCDFDLRCPKGNASDFYRFASGPSRKDRSRYVVSFETEWHDEHGADCIPAEIVMAYRRLATLLDCDLTITATAVRGEECDCHELILENIQADRWPIHITVALAVMGLVFNEKFPMLASVEMKKPTWNIVS